MYAHLHTFFQLAASGTVVTQKSIWGADWLYHAIWPLFALSVTEPKLGRFHRKPYPEAAQ